MEDAATIAPHFQDAGQAREFLEAKRWPNGPVCAHWFFPAGKRDK